MVDELDLKLIRELQKDGRATHVELARKLNVVEGTVRKRIRKLELDGVMKTMAVPNLRELGYDFVGFMALQVQVSRLREIADKLVQKPNVCYLAFVTGRFDMIAIVMTRSPQEFARFAEKEISTIPSILRIETWVNLETLKGGWLSMDTTRLLADIAPSQVEKTE